jgi:tRNA uridine 5-carboxymethylaminomethyl modification enzyme
MAAASIFAQLTEQPGDEPRPVFSFLGSRAQHPAQLPVLDHAYERANA